MPKKDYFINAVQIDRNRWQRKYPDGVVLQASGKPLVGYCERKGFC